MTCQRCDSCLVIWLTRDESRVNRVGEMDNQRCVRHRCGSCLFGSGNETFPCNILWSFYGLYTRINATAKNYEIIRAYTRYKNLEGIWKCEGKHYKWTRKWGLGQFGFKYTLLGRLPFNWIYASMLFLNVTLAPRYMYTLIVSYPTVTVFVYTTLTIMDYFKC